MQQAAEAAKSGKETYRGSAVRGVYLARRRKRQGVVHFRLPMRLRDSQLKHMEHSVFSTPAGQTNRVHFGTNTNFDKVQTS